MNVKTFFASLFVNSIIPFWTSSFKTSIFVRRFCHMHTNYENKKIHENQDKLWKKVDLNQNQTQNMKIKKQKQSMKNKSLNEILFW